MDANIDVRWFVMSGDPDFFSITKRIHNRLHGTVGDAGGLSGQEVAHYREITDSNAVSMIGRVRSGDVVLLHDPQTVGMAQALADVGARVVWRCHIGRVGINGWTEEAWSFLRPHLEHCEAYIFSMPEYVPAWIDDAKVRIIPPSIDPFSPKNQAMSQRDVVLTLDRIGLLHGESEDPPGAFARGDGTAGHVERRAVVVSANSSPLRPDVPLVLQVSRWDRLKDMKGVMEGFIATVPTGFGAHLALVGPSVSGVADDPEGAQVYAECLANWENLPPPARQRVTLVNLPMVDVDENAAMVNAIQRHATVIVQKSLEEGFGLTVAEGMWKEKAVVASAIGGITKQIVPGTGILLRDPTDLTAFGLAVTELLAHPGDLVPIGARAREHVLDHFVTDKHLLLLAQLMVDLSG
jgi:trehalose synthase